MNQQKTGDLKDFLETKYHQYGQSFFIESDPVSIPHLFTARQDREIAGFLTATISWGQRRTILKNARALLSRMDDAPHDFILGFNEADMEPFRNFVHRTFNGVDCIYFLKALQSLYRDSGGLQGLFEDPLSDSADLLDVIPAARNIFFSFAPPSRTRKHFPDPSAGSAAKRINMFLRWMVRKDASGIDFGIWKKMKPAQLICPLDVHSARVARKLGLLSRKQNDWKAAAELTGNLRLLDPLDPVKYDLALFGLGVFEKF